MLNGDSCHSLLWYGARSRAYIEDGRFCNEELLHLVQTDERLYSVKKNAKTIDLLIIDNFAMVNTARLNQLEVLCRKLGIFCFIIWWNVCMQRMFYQLPLLLAYELLGDPWNYCYRLQWFNECFSSKETQQHLVHLSHVYKKSICLEPQTIFKTRDLLECITNVRWIPSVCKDIFCKVHKYCIEICKMGWSWIFT